MVPQLAIALALFDPYFMCPPNETCKYMMVFTEVNLLSAKRERRELEEFSRNYRLFYGETAYENTRHVLEQNIAIANRHERELSELFVFWGNVDNLRSPVFPVHYRSESFKSCQTFLGNSLWWSGQWWPRILPKMFDPLTSTKGLVP